MWSHVWRMFLRQGDGGGRETLRSRTSMAKTNLWSFSWRKTKTSDSSRAWTSGAQSRKEEKKKKKKKNVFLTFSDKLTLLKCTEEIYCSLCLPFSLPWLLFSCSTPSWISLRRSRSCLAKTWPLFITMMDLLSMRPWNSFRRRFFSCSFTLLSTATITSFSSRMDSVRSSKSSTVSVFLTSDRKVRKATPESG